jgi:ABC-type nitrate/sulfonate/bicarbonate transport system permease component
MTAAPSLTATAPVRQASVVDRHRQAVFAVRLAVIALVLVIWQVNPAHFLPVYAFGSPASVARELWDLVSSGKIFGQIGATALAVFYAMIIALPVGVAAGLLSKVRFLEWVLEPIMTLLYAVPKLGVISLLILILGVNGKAHVALVVLTVSFIYYYAARQALDDVDQNQVTAMRLMGASTWKVGRSLLLPSSVPHLLASTRLSLPLALAFEIFAEIAVPAGGSGLGVILGIYQNNADASGSVAIMLVGALLGYLLAVVLGRYILKYTKSIGAGI